MAAWCFRHSDDVSMAESRSLFSGGAEKIQGGARFSMTPPFPAAATDISARHRLAPATCNTEGLQKKSLEASSSVTGRYDDAAAMVSGRVNIELTSQLPIVGWRIRFASLFVNVDRYETIKCGLCLGNQCFLVECIPETWPRDFVGFSMERI